MERFNAERLHQLKHRRTRMLAEKVVSLTRYAKLSGEIKRVEKLPVSLDSVRRALDDTELIANRNQPPYPYLLQ